MRLLGLCATGLVVLFVSGAAKGREHSPHVLRNAPCAPAAGTELHGASFQGFGRPVDPRIFAQVAVAQDRATGIARGFVLFVRGTPEWHGGGPRVVRTDTTTSADGRWIIERRFDSITLVAFLYPREGLLRVGGSDIGLDTTNVLLLDRVDGEGGTPSVRAAGCVPLMPTGDAIERAIATLPAVRAFIQ